MKRKGQITFYIIIGVLLVMMFGLFMVMQNREEIVGVQPEIFESVGNYVQACLTTSATEALLDLGYHGGVVEPRDWVSTDIGRVPRMTSKLNQDDFLDIYSEKTLSLFQSCIGDFEILRNKGFVFETFSMELDIVAKDKINMDLNFPLKATKNNAVKAFSEFKFVIDLDLNEIINVTNILYEAAQKPGIPISTMLDVQEQTGLEVNAYAMNKTIVYTVEDSESLLQGYNYLMLFAVEVDKNE